MSEHIKSKSFRSAGEGNFFSVPVIEYNYVRYSNGYL